MSERRFFEPDAPLEGECELTRENARIARDVLRLKVGDAVELLNGTGVLFLGTLCELGKRSAVVRIAKTRRVPFPAPEITLIQGLPKGEKGAWIVEKSVELGVAKLVFLQCRNSVPRPAAEKTIRWKKVAVEAMRQCGNPHLPEVAGPLPPEEALIRFPADVSVLFDEDRRELRPGSGAFPPGTASIRAAVGPEGGWSAGERDLFDAAGFIPLGLGPFVLRVETAAVAAIATLRALLR